VEFPPLQLHLLSALKVLRSKQQNMLGQGVAKLAHLTTTTLFQYVVGVNGLKGIKDCLNPLPINTTI
jgi:hypothetical protein